MAHPDLHDIAQARKKISCLPALIIAVSCAWIIVVLLTAKGAGARVILASTSDYARYNATGGGNAPGLPGVVRLDVTPQAWHGLVAAHGQPAPHRALYRRSAPGNQVPGRYLIQLQAGVSDADRNAHFAAVQAQITQAANGNQSYGILEKMQLQSGWAYSVAVPQGVLQQIQAMPGVQRAEPVQIVQSAHIGAGNETHRNLLQREFWRNPQPLSVPNAGAATSPKPARRLLARDTAPAFVQQGNIQNWGLTQLSSANAGGNSYTFPSSAGANVNVYIVDTGVDGSHQEFRTADGSGSRVQYGYTLSSSTADTKGHGTHVAGIAAGLTVGVAKAATVWAQQCLDDQSMQYSDILLVCLLATVNHAVNQGRRAVINLSLRMGTSPLMDDIVNQAVGSGIVVVVAAGNDGADDGACAISPARNPNVISVGATTAEVGLASFSNDGLCTDLYAPGNSILSAATGTTDGYVEMSGTSMATPFVSGAAALVLSMWPQLTPQQVRSLLTNRAFTNTITGLSSDSVNLRLATPADSWEAPS